MAPAICRYRLSDEQKWLGPVYKSREEAISFLFRQTSFPRNLDKSRIYFTIDDCEVSDEVWEAAVEISSEGKKVVELGVRFMSDVQDDEVQQVKGPAPADKRVKIDLSPPPQDGSERGKKRPRTDGKDGKVTITCRSIDQSLSLIVRPSTPVIKVIKAIGAHFPAFDPDGRDVDLRLDNSANIVRLDEKGILEDYHIGPGLPRTELWFQRCQIGGKPVIYIYPKEERDFSCRLELVPEWSFATIYPPAKIGVLPTKGQRIEWNVYAEPSGDLTLLDENWNAKEQGLTVSYLFWEARTNSVAGRPPPPAPSINASTSSSSNGVMPFDPSSVTVAPSDSILLHIDEVTCYLDAALKSLGLHTEARTSFITYWLPSFERHVFLALRFLPQASYELAAPLTLNPPADVKTRVFLLFQGLTRDEAAASWWAPAKTRRAQMDVERWRDIVGVENGARQQDRSLTRVLEWGGMEVHAG